VGAFVRPITNVAQINSPVKKKHQKKDQKKDQKKLDFSFRACYLLVERW